MIKFGYESKVHPNQFTPITFNLEPEWRDCAHYYDLKGCKADESSVFIEADKSIEIKDVKVLRVKSPLIEPIKTDNSLMDKRIQIHREDLFTISVKDKSGKALKGAHVKIQQVRHQFLFGSYVKNIGDNENTSKNFAELFNFCSMPLAWDEVEPRKGQSNFYALDRSVAWCEKNKIAIRLTPLITDLNYPNWAPKDEEGAKSALRGHIFNCVKHFASSVHYWDVYVSPLVPREISQIGYGSLLNQASGDTKLILRGLQFAHLADPTRQCVFMYGENDFLHLTSVLDALNQAHSAPDAIGIQVRISSTSALEVAKQCRAIYSTYRLPIHLTIFNYSEIDVNQLKELYSIFFANPEVQSITWSDTTYRQKVHDELMQLIHHKWWTNFEGPSNDKGILATKAFFGDYIVTVTGSNGKTTKTNFIFSSAQSAPKELTVLLP